MIGHSGFISLLWLLEGSDPRDIPLRAYLCVYNIEIHIANLRYQAMCFLEKIASIHGYYSGHACDH